METTSLAAACMLLVWFPGIIRSVYRAVCRNFAKGGGELAVF